MAQGVVARNPAALVKPVPTEKPAMATLSAAQVAALSTAAAPLGAAVSQRGAAKSS